MESVNYPAGWYDQPEESEHSEDCPCFTEPSRICVCAEILEWAEEEAAERKQKLWEEREGA